MFLTTGFPALKIFKSDDSILLYGLEASITFQLLWNLTARLLTTYHTMQFRKKYENHLNSKTDRLDFFLNLVDTTSMV